MGRAIQGETKEGPTTDTEASLSSRVEKLDDFKRGQDLQERDTGKCRKKVIGKPRTSRDHYQEIKTPSFSKRATATHKGRGEGDIKKKTIEGGGKLLPGEGDDSVIGVNAVGGRLRAPPTQRGRERGRCETKGGKKN